MTPWLTKSTAPLNVDGLCCGMAFRQADQTAGKKQHNVTIRLATPGRLLDFLQTAVSCTWI